MIPALLINPRQASAAVATNSSAVTNLTTGIAGLSGSNFRDIATTPSGDSVVALVDLGDIFLSSDAGSSWTNLTTGTSLSGLAWRSVAISANGQIIFAAAYGGDIYKSTNSGASWNSVTATTGHNLNWTSISISDDGNRIFAAPTGNYVHISQNGGTTWVVQRPLPPGYSDVTRTYNNISTNSSGSKFVVSYGLGSVISSLTPDTTTAEINGSSFVVADIALSRDGTRFYTMETNGTYKLQVWSRVSGITYYFGYANTYCYLNGCPGGTFVATNGDGRVAIYGGSATQLILSTNTGYSYATLTNSSTADWRGAAFNESGSIAYAIANGGDIFKVSLDPTTFQFGTMFHGAGGFGVCNNPLVANGLITLLTAVQCTRNGYTLDAWRINGVNYAPGSTYTVTSQTNAEAQWSTNYTLTFSGNLNNGGSAPGSITASSGSIITLPANTGNLAKNNLAFNGWNTLSTGLGVSYAAGSSYTLNSTTTLYAKWSTGVSTPVTLSSVSNPRTYRTQVGLLASVAQAGKITFYANGKKISGCISKSITSTYTCQWKPAFHGGNIVTAQLRPTNTGYALSTSNAVLIGAQPRSTNR